MPKIPFDEVEIIGLTADGWNLIRNEKEAAEREGELLSEALAEAEGAGLILTPEMVDALACERSDAQPWGWDEYRKDAQGHWYLDHQLIVNEAKRESYRLYLDGRPAEIIKWAA